MTQAYRVCTTSRCTSVSAPSAGSASSTDSGSLTLCGPAGTTATGAAHHNGFRPGSTTLTDGGCARCRQSDRVVVLIGPSCR